ncbi:MAG TPA: GNAT family N-acetyltransferase [Candidatus Kryptonia bacterium]|nr:GNAT family N-acetyltransferase [Candidatus Kryptonia bacterium]
MTTDDTLTIRTIAPHERDAVLDLLDQWISREFFARYFDHDPAFRDDFCFVAVDGGRIVSTLQVFGKDVRLGGTTVRVGGVGNVFTAAAYRERGTASRLLTRAIAAMNEQGFDLSLLFAVRLAFYGRHGWCSYPRQFVFLDPGRAMISDRYRLEAFDRDRDLTQIMGLYEAHSGALPGTTVRDRDYWLGQLRYAGNFGEDFLVARAGDRLVAYARATSLYDYYVLMEHGHLPGHEPALVDLVCRLHGHEGSALPGTLTQLATAPRVVSELTARGLTLRTIEDMFWMWRVISPTRLARKLGVSPAEVEQDDFLPRLLPPDRSVFWLSDRF